jgi:hypothetical protein
MVSTRSTLRTAGARSDGVSRPLGSKSAAFPKCSAGMRRHCVSHPLLLVSDQFPKDHGDFWPHCVSHRLPPKSRLRRVIQAADHHLHPHLLGLLLGGVGLPPPGTGPAVALALTVCRAAHALAITGTRVRTEPAAADPAWTRAKHPRSCADPAAPADLLRELSGQLREWTHFHEQTRVNSGERRSSRAGRVRVPPGTRAAS